MFSRRNIFQLAVKGSAAALSTAYLSGALGEDEPSRNEENSFDARKQRRMRLYIEKNFDLPSYKIEKVIEYINAEANRAFVWGGAIGGLMAYVPENEKFSFRDAEDKLGFSYDPDLLKNSGQHSAMAFAVETLLHCYRYQHHDQVEQYLKSIKIPEDQIEELGAYVKKNLFKGASIATSLLTTALSPSFQEPADESPAP